MGLLLDIKSKVPLRIKYSSLYKKGMTVKVESRLSARSIL